MGTTGWFELAHGVPDLSYSRFSQGRAGPRLTEVPAASCTSTTPATGARLTTNLGILLADNQNSLRAAVRGPTLLEDFALREKIHHFDHERIRERIVLSS